MIEETEALKGAIEANNHNNQPASDEQNEQIERFISSFFTKSELADIEKLLRNPLTYNSVDVSNKVQPDDNLGLLLYNLIHTWTSPLAKRLLHRKSEVEGYDYADMLKMYVDTVHNLDPKHRDYILLRSIEAAVADNAERIMAMLSSSLNMKEMMIANTLDMLRMLMPYFIVSCKEYYEGFRTIQRFDQYIEKYLKTHKIAIEKRLQEIDKMFERLRSVTPGDVVNAAREQTEEIESVDESSDQEAKQ